jgi:holo-[acyl-carrier protein] synthase
LKKLGIVLIRGIGIDVVDIERIRKIIEKYGKHFIEKIFTRNEITYCSAQVRSEIHFAGRFAAKEAFYKALPLQCQSVSTWKSISILPGSDNGKPEISINNEILQDSLIIENITSIQVSISHEKSICTSIVIIE